ncbi:MAG: helix-turn-helix transcriptional regulator [Actinobacteria bacterium]|nr:helix-turn-helix transcriptional regulator [Actinomycetota bacterium]
MKLIQVIDEACCAPVLEAPPSPEEAARLAAALRVVADPARLRLLGLIGARPGGEACVCDLTEPLGLSQPTVSHHLKVLHEAGLLDRERRGSWVHYRVRPDRLRPLAEALGGGPASAPGPRAPSASPRGRPRASRPPGKWHGARDASEPPAPS